MLPQSGMRQASRFVVRSGLASTVLAFVVVSACGSDDGKKKAGPQYDSGGEGGGGANGVSGSKGTPGGTSGSAGEAVIGNGGQGATGTEGGTSPGVAGQGTGGEAGAPATDCPAGTADCDDDPSDCEANVTLLTQCGACGVSCQDTNGTVICGDKGCEMTSCMAGFGDCNESGTDGCEVDLKTAKNCGVCGHDCGAAACTAGLCAPTQLGSVVAAYRWAATSDAVYRFSCKTVSAYLPSDCELIRTPLNGSAEVSMVNSSKGIGSVTVDANSVYWSIVGTPAAVVKKAHTAAAVVTPTPMFEPVSLPVQLEIQGNAMYWMGLDGQIYTRALNAGIADPGTLLVSAADVKGTGKFDLQQDFVTTPTAMYWVVLPTAGTNATIRTATLSGQNVADVPGAITNTYFKLWVNGEDLYWVRATNAALDGAYHFKKGGAVEPLVLEGSLNAVLADGDYLYLGKDNDKLLRAPIAGGAFVNLGAGTLLDFAASDEGHVYGLAAFSHGGGFGGGSKLFSFPK